MIEVRRLKGEPDPLADLRPELREALRSMNFDERLEAARIARAEALAAKSEPPPPVPTPEIVDTPEPPKRRAAPLIAAFGVVLLAAIGVLSTTAGQPDGPPPTIQYLSDQQPIPAPPDTAPVSGSVPDIPIILAATAPLATAPRANQSSTPDMTTPRPQLSVSAPRLASLTEIPRAVSNLMSPVTLVTSAAPAALTGPSVPRAPDVQTTPATRVAKSAPAITPMPRPVAAAPLVAKATLRVFTPIRTPRADQLGAQLSQAGYDIAAVNVVGYAIPQDEVRYGDPADAPLAAAIARTVGASPLQVSAPGWPSGTVELWLSGTATPVSNVQLVSARPAQRPLAGHGVAR